MSNFLKVEMLVKVSGYDINEDNTIQIQNVSFNDKGKLVKNTVKIHKSYNEDTLKGLVGKTVKVLEVEEFRKGFKVYYAGKDIKKVDNQDIEFQVNKELTMKVDNVVEAKEDTTLQSIINNGTRADLFNIKIKGFKKSLLEDLKGSNVVIKGVKVSKIEGSGTFYSSTQKPVRIA